eukprot:512358-Ditylum_brightwellii.AAC.1
MQNKLLEHCNKECNTDIIGNKISVEDLKDKIRVWKEQTTTSPPGKHLGHFKTLISRGAADPTLEEGKEFHVKQQAL